MFSAPAMAQALVTATRTAAAAAAGYIAEKAEGHAYGTQTGTTAASGDEVVVKADRNVFEERGHKRQKVVPAEQQ